MKIKHLTHFLLVFIASAGEIGSTPNIRSTCSVVLEKTQLKIEETPINFRNSSLNENEKQIFMRLTDLSENDKDCMDRNTFNLKINLNLTESIKNHKVKVGRIATQHNVGLGKKYVRIESCTFDDQKISDQHRMFLNFIDNLKGKEQENFQEIIIFMAPVELWGLEKNITSLEIDFEDKDSKKICEIYSGCFYKSFLIEQ